MDIKFFYLDGFIPFICKTLLKFDQNKVVESHFTYNETLNRYEPKNFSTDIKNFLVVDIITEQLRFDGKEFSLVDKALSSDREFLHSKTFFNTLRYLYQLNFTVLLDYTIEGAFIFRGTLKSFLEAGAKFNYFFENVIFVTNNSHHIDNNKIDYGDTPLKVLHFPLFLLNAHIASVTDDTFSFKDILSTAKTKLFNIAVRKAKLPRIILLNKLDKNGFLDESDWSCSAIKAVKYKDTSSLKKQYDEYTTFFKKYDILNNFKIIPETTIVDTKSNINDDDRFFNPVKYPKLLKSIKRDNIARDSMYEEIDIFNKISNYHIWSRSKVHIVPETHNISVYSYPKHREYPTINCVHLTEKIFKTIRLGMPFVIFGQKNSLSHLRKLGFKTFNKVVDEAYDYFDLSLDSTDNPFSTLTPREFSNDLETYSSQIIKTGLELSHKYNNLEVLKVCEYNFNLIRNRTYIVNLLENIFYSKLNKLSESN